MKNKIKYILPAIALGVVFSSSAFAHGMGGAKSPEDFQAKFEQTAKLLGVSTDEVKEAWAQGKSMIDLAKEKGITEDQFREKMKAFRMEERKKDLQDLVSKGVITQKQADTHYNYILNNQDKMEKGKGKHFAK